MTYVVDDRRRQMAPRSLSPVSRSPLGPQNSLDYWQKAEDRQGVTYYWNNGKSPGSPPNGLENIYAPQTVLARRPAPFPINLPAASQGQAAGSRAASAVPVSHIPIYHNVPAVPRVRLSQNKSVPSLGSQYSTRMANENSVYAPKSPPLSTEIPEKEKSRMIWSVSTDKYSNSAPPPDSHYTNSGHAPALQATVYPVRRGKTRSREQKPRWGRFMQSLCCCVSPQREMEKPTTPRTSPSSLITQVQKNGTVVQPPPASEGKQNDYSQVPAVPVLSPPTQTKTCERFLLPPLRPADVNKKCLIIDLDETLVHSSFKPVKNADFVIPVEIDGIEHKVYVLKRPYVDEFLARVGERYECVLFTASLAKYADPVADLLDKRGVFRSRLFREACVYNKGNYVKDLSRLGRDLHKVLIIDNSPASYAFHPDNAIPVQTWFDDPTDVELLDILPLLDRMEKQESVYDVLRPHDNCASDSLLDHN